MGEDSSLVGPPVAQVGDGCRNSFSYAIRSEPERHSDERERGLEIRRLTDRPEENVADLIVNRVPRVFHASRLPPARPLSTDELTGFLADNPRVDSRQHFDGHDQAVGAAAIDALVDRRIHPKPWVSRPLDARNDFVPKPVDVRPPGASESFDE